MTTHTKHTEQPHRYLAPLLREAVQSGQIRPQIARIINRLEHTDDQKKVLERAASLHPTEVENLVNEVMADRWIASAKITHTPKAAANLDVADYILRDEDVSSLLEDQSTKVGRAKAAWGFLASPQIVFLILWLAVAAWLWKDFQSALAGWL